MIRASSAIWLLTPDQQDKRSVVPLAPADWTAWLSGDEAQARALLRVPGVDLFNPSDADLTDLALVSRGPA